MSDRSSYDSGASGYDRGFGSVSSTFVPTLLRIANLGVGQRVLDVATGTGVAAEAASAIVGPSGRVVASDISVQQLEQSRVRLGGLANVSFAIEDGEALTFRGESFDTVVCGAGLMLFPSPARGLSEFRRVLRGGGRAAVSVNTTLNLSFVSRVSAAIGRHVPSRAAVAARFFSLGDADRLRTLFEAAGFRDVATIMETRSFPYPSFDAYFDPIEAGLGNIGVEFVSLTRDVRPAVRDEVRCELESTDGSRSRLRCSFCSEAGGNRRRRTTTKII